MIVHEYKVKVFQFFHPTFHQRFMKKTHSCLRNARTGREQAKEDIKIKK